MHYNSVTAHQGNFLFGFRQLLIQAGVFYLQGIGLLSYRFRLSLSSVICDF